MRILIVSDTHRKHDNLKTVLDRVKPLDMLIHLGDAEGCEDEIAEMAQCPMEIVAGNSDFFSRLDREREITIGKYHVWLTHGNYYYVTDGIEDIKKEAQARKMDIVMFGHTHRPIVDYGNHVIAVNPGSISNPRQEGRQPSYIMMEVDKKGEAHFTINYLN